MRFSLKPFTEPQKWLITCHAICITFLSLSTLVFAR